MNIREKINQFTSFTLEGDRKDGDIRKLIEALDELPFLVYASDFEFDGTDYPDAPTRDYQTIRSAIERKFPELGYYKTADYDDNLECTGNILIGDAIDDITDIVGDLLEVEWYFANTSEGGCAVAPRNKLQRALGQSSARSSVIFIQAALLMATNKHSQCDIYSGARFVPENPGTKQSPT